MNKTHINNVVYINTMSVINCKVCNIRPMYNNLKEWCDEEDNVYIGRRGVVFIDGKRYPVKSSIFSNPYKIKNGSSRDDVLEEYRSYMEKKLEKNVELQEMLLELKGKNLGCWCCPKRCHGDILLELIQKYDKN
jgi:hypothetical protein